MPHRIKERRHLEDCRRAAGDRNYAPAPPNEVSRKNLSINTLVCATAENPSRIFEIKDKGRIAEGYDADIVLVDLDREYTIRNNAIRASCGWSPYDGMTVKGAVVKTILRGAVIYDNPCEGDAQVYPVKGLEVGYL